MRDLELWLYFIAFGQGLTVHPSLAWYSLCMYSKGVQAGLRPLSFCCPGAWVSGMHHHHGAVSFFSLVIALSTYSELHPDPF